MASLKNNLSAYAHSLGFSAFRITNAAPLTENAAHLKQWLAQGFEGEMAYMRREPEGRADPQARLPGAKSVIVMTMPYTESVRQCGCAEVQISDKTSAQAKVSKYTSGVDYHKTIQKRLDAFVRYLEAVAPDCKSRTFIDTGPLLERALAQRAGIGFVGKNTLVITRDQGSWVFIASVITTLELPVDAPDTRTCGMCRLCLDACPTHAFAGPFELDARKCISYLTIEYDGSIDLALREQMGEWVFGCDVCQDVCPHNKRHSQENGFQASLPLEEILSLSEEQFQQRFQGTAFMRAGRQGLLRNACVAAANLKRRDLLEILEALASYDASPVVREHSSWAVEKLRASDGTAAV